MKTPIVDRAHFVYLADIEPVSAPQGLFQLTLSTQWRQAKNPDAEHVKARVLVDEPGLRRLRELVDAALGEPAARWQP